MRATSRESMLQQLIVSALIASKWQLVGGETTGRSKWKHAEKPHAGFIYVGYNGSVRRGSTRATSRPIAPDLKLALINRGKELLRIRTDSASNL